MIIYQKQNYISLSKVEIKMMILEEIPDQTQNCCEFKSGSVYKKSKWFPLEG